MQITDFFMTNYVDASSYDNLRKIASVADGLKNSGRKVIDTVLDRNIVKETKVSRLKSTVAEHTEYLHGEDNLASVIVNLARRYPGTNNLPLLRDEGNFGKRFINEASADRYISSGSERYLKNIFMSTDSEILIKQEFEGEEIEPRFFVPIIPMILVNGAPNSISVGFAQNILPRPVNQIIKMVETYLDTGKVKVPKPGWNGFKGTVKQGTEKNKWVVYGKFERINSTVIEITEIPVDIELKAYLKILDDLEDNKIISSYEDHSEEDNFKFRIRAPRKFVSQDDEVIYETLSLKDAGKNRSENYTLMGVDNRILVLETTEQIFMEYAKVREEYYEKRRIHLIDKTIAILKKLGSRYFFIKGVVDDEITINKKSKAEVVKQLEGNAKIIPDENDSYDFLLRMPIYSLTKEKMNELRDEIKLQKGLLDKYKNAEVKEMWREDLEELKVQLKQKH
jgi:DNA topoisomerase-2